MGQRDFKAENYEAATKDAENGLSLATSPKQQGDALMLLGETYYRREMYGEAQVQWAKMLALPEIGDTEGLHLIAHLGSARTYSAQGQFERAALEYRAVTSESEAHIQADGDANPTETRQMLAPFYFALANAYSHTKQYDLAAEQLKQVIQYSDGDSGYRLLALVKRGQIEVIQRDFKGALNSFNQVVALTQAAPESEPTEITGKIKTLIPLLQSLVNSQVGAGQPRDGKMKITVVPAPKFDQAADTASKLILDAFFAGLVSNSPEE